MEAYTYLNVAALELPFKGCAVDIIRYDHKGYSALAGPPGGELLHYLCYKYIIIL